MEGFTASAALALIGLGFVVGAFGTLVGAGGGFILTPVLLVVYPHDSPQTITAISIAVVFFNASSGTVAYARQRRIDYRSGAVFACATVPGSIVGALAVDAVPRRAFDAIAAALLLSISAWLLVGAAARRAPAGSDGVPRGRGDAREGVESPPVRLLLGALLSLVVGFVSSFLGVGGGILQVPLLIQVLGFPVHVATATSHFVLVVMSGSGALTHLLQGGYRVGHGLRRTLALSAGVVAGAQVGAHVSLRTRGPVIQRALGLALLALGARLAVGL